MPVTDTQLQNLIKIPKVRKGSNYKHEWPFKASLASSATSTCMRLDWRLRYNTFRQPGLQPFPLRSHSIVASQWTGIQHSQCMQLRMLFLEQR